MKLSSRLPLENVSEKHAQNLVSFCKEDPITKKLYIDDDCVMEAFDGFKSQQPEIQSSLIWAAKETLSKHEIQKLTESLPELSDVQTAYLKGYNSIIGLPEHRSPQNNEIPASNIHEAVNTKINFNSESNESLPELFPIKEDGSGPLIVWKAENQDASQGQTVSVGLDNSVQATSGGIKGKYSHITGQTVPETIEGIQPYSGQETKITNDAYDQVQVAWAADHILKRCKNLGLNIDMLLEHTINDGIIRAYVNDPSSMAKNNAFFSPSENKLVTGTCDDNWHVGTDGDVVVHELGHLVLDHINPEMPSDSLALGGALHEGFADGFASCMFVDPEMAEDFADHIPDLSDHLRNLDNDLSLDDVDTESHARGQVFGGYFWSCKKKLEGFFGDARMGAELTLGTMLHHAFFLGTTKITGEVFVESMIKGANAFLGPKLTKKQNEAFTQFLIEEGIKRKFIDKDWTPSQTQEQILETIPSDLEKQELKQTILDMAYKHSGIDPNGPIKLKFINKQQIGQHTKLILKAEHTDPDTKQTFPIEDGHLALLFKGRNLIHVVGSATKLPPQFTYNLRDLKSNSIIRSAKRHSLKLAHKKKDIYRSFCKLVEEHIDDIYHPDHVAIEKVLHRGRLCYLVKTKVGTLILNPDRKTVRVKNLLMLN